MSVIEVSPASMAAYIPVASLKGLLGEPIARFTLSVISFFTLLSIDVRRESTSLNPVSVSALNVSIAGVMPCLLAAQVL